jgi:hypothetical protein
MRSSLAQCEQVLSATDAVSGPATPDEIGRALRELMAGYLGHGKGELKAFGAILTKQIFELNPSFLALEKGCNQVLLESTFFPSVAAIYQSISKVDSDIIELRETSERLRKSCDRLQKAKDADDAQRASDLYFKRRRDCIALIRSGGDVSEFDSDMVAECRKFLAAIEHE